MSYRKRPLRKGWYHCTIRDADEIDGKLRLVWTVDRGDYVYRNVIENYGLNEEGISLLEDRMLELGYIIYRNYNDPFFFDQFTISRFRADLHIDRMAENNMIRNVIVERRVPTKPMDYNVKKPKSDTFYQKKNKGRLLPIKEVNPEMDNEKSSSETPPWKES